MALAFVSDTFTDSNGTNLTSHTGEVGATWTQHPVNGGGASAFVINASGDGVLFGSLDTLNLLYASGIPASAEYDVRATLRYNGGNLESQSFGINGRVSTSQWDAWNLQYNGFSGTGWSLEEVVNGSATIHDTQAQTLVEDTEYELLLEIRNDAIRGYVDSVLKVEYTGSQTITAAGRVAILGFSETDTDPSPDGIHILDIEATNPGVTLTANAASWTFTGSSATLRVARKLVTSAASLAWTGNSAAVLHNAKLVATALGMTWTGTAATLTYSGTPAAFVRVVSRIAKILREWDGDALITRIVSKTSQIRRSDSHNSEL